MSSDGNLPPGFRVTTTPPNAGKWKDSHDEQKTAAIQAARKARKNDKENTTSNDGLVPIQETDQLSIDDTEQIQIDEIKDKPKRGSRSRRGSLATARDTPGTSPSRLRRRLSKPGSENDGKPKEPPKTSDGFEHRLYLIDRNGTGDVHYFVIDDSEEKLTTLNPVTEKWKWLENYRDFEVVVMDNKLYVIGGAETKLGKVTDRMIRYDPVENAWALRCPMLAARCKCAAASARGNILVTGGEKNDGKVTGTCEIYEPEENKWKKAGHLPKPRANHRCVAGTKEAYLSGGSYDGEGHNNLWIFEEHRWKELDSHYPQRMGFNLDKHMMVNVDGTLYFIGGVNYSQPVPTKGEYSLPDPQASPRDLSSCMSAETSDRVEYFRTKVRYSNIKKNKDARKGLWKKDKPTSGIGDGQNDRVTPWGKGLPKMKYGRQNGGQMRMGNRIYVFGGSSQTLSEIKQVEYMNLDNNKWYNAFTLKNGDFSNIVCVKLKFPLEPHDMKPKVSPKEFVMALNS
ncbi:unnamed protein product [Owenia fusiformis]|uniref:Uncharacterized protein n=1 Tax=Owenia fusiformis TaxID=6347 RepID=A0A8J1YCD6_OWEFU|nr:unnamed protein product [Owenia fusiformis]